MRPFFSYYGGKWRDARNYPPPAHATLVEPFAGSAGYAVRYPDRRVVLCDLDPVIVGVWNYLIRVSPAEVLAIPDVPANGTVDDLHVPQEARWLVGFWLNKANASPCRSPSAWRRSGLYSNSFWGPRVRETIAAQVECIRHWRIVECSYDACPVDGDATWFVDPPYRGAGKYYRKSDAGIDFAHLAGWCRSRTGRVIVCENAGADWLPFAPVGSTKTTRAGRRSAEAAWVRDIAADAGPLFAWRAA
jgi:hypothetical protein